MCSRKYDIRLCLEYILEDVLLVNRAKITAGPPSFAPLCSSKVLGRQVPKAEGDPGLIMRFEFSEGLSE